MVLTSGNNSDKFYSRIIYFILGFGLYDEKINSPANCMLSSQQFFQSVLPHELGHADRSLQSANRESFFHGGFKFAHQSLYHLQVQNKMDFICIRNFPG